MYPIVAIAIKLQKNRTLAYNIRFGIWHLAINAALCGRIRCAIAAATPPIKAEPHTATAAAGRARHPAPPNSSPGRRAGQIIRQDSYMSPSASQTCCQRFEELRARAA